MSKLGSRRGYFSPRAMLRALLLLILGADYTSAKVIRSDDLLGGEKTIDQRVESVRSHFANDLLTIQIIDKAHDLDESKKQFDLTQWGNWGNWNNWNNWLNWNNWNNWGNWRNF